MNELRTKLEEDKKLILSRINAFEKDKSRSNYQLSQDLEDQAQEIVNDEVVDQLEELNLAKLKSLDHALERIDLGEYETCSNCGQKIELKRLNAMPTTTLCKNCAL